MLASLLQGHVQQAQATAAHLAGSMAGKKVSHSRSAWIWVKWITPQRGEAMASLYTCPPPITTGAPPAAAAQGGDGICWPVRVRAAQPW